MIILILGLVLFLGMHSSRIVFESYRSRFARQYGLGAWKGLYSLISIIGFGLIIWGYAQARYNPVILWVMPIDLSHLVATLMLPAIILLAATYTPMGRLKAAVKHPMIISVKIWAFAHLLVNGTLADVILFGSILIWAVVDLISSKKRAPIVENNKISFNVYDMMAVIIGASIWAGLVFWAHEFLFGVAPLA